MTFQLGVGQGQRDSATGYLNSCVKKQTGPRPPDSHWVSPQRVILKNNHKSPGSQSFPSFRARKAFRITQRSHKESKGD